MNTSKMDHSAQRSRCNHRSVWAGQSSGRGVEALLDLLRPYLDHYLIPARMLPSDRSSSADGQRPAGHPGQNGERLDQLRVDLRLPAVLNSSLRLSSYGSMNRFRSEADVPPNMRHDCRRQPG